MLGKGAPTRVSVAGARVRGECANLLGEILWRCAHGDEVLDTAGGAICEPVEKVVVVPERRMRPKLSQMCAEDTLDVGVLGKRDALSDVAGVVEIVECNARVRRSNASPCGKRVPTELAMADQSSGLPCCMM